MDSGTAQPNGAADVYAALFPDATITTDDFLSHDVTTEERPGGAGACSQSSFGHSNDAGDAGACSQSSSGHSNDAGGAGACSKSSSGCASARKRTKRTPKQYKVLKIFAGVPITTHTLKTGMLSKRAPEADTYVNNLCLLAQATGATRKSDVGMKSAGDVGYILACKSSQCPVQFKVVITPKAFRCKRATRRCGWQMSKSRAWLLAWMGTLPHIIMHTRASQHLRTYWPRTRAKLPVTRPGY